MTKSDTAAHGKEAIRQTGVVSSYKSPNWELRSFPSAKAQAQGAAAQWLELLNGGHRNLVRSVAVSGGNNAASFFAAVAGMADTRHDIFSRVHFFFADERCVPPTSAESNFRLASEGLFQPLRIAPVMIHRVRGEAEPPVAVAEANADFQRFAAAELGGKPVLDLVLLGMGEDGHVASLFPNATDEIFACTLPYLFVGDSPKPPPRRISLSLAAITAARRVWVLASGLSKKEALRRSLGPDATTPLARVLRSRQETWIFTDLPINDLIP